jgi:hypothetical protein
MVGYKPYPLPYVTVQCNRHRILHVRGPSVENRVNQLAVGLLLRNLFCWFKRDKRSQLSPAMLDASTIILPNYCLLAPFMTEETKTKDSWEEPSLSRDAKGLRLVVIFIAV